MNRSERAFRPRAHARAAPLSLALALPLLAPAAARAQDAAPVEGIPGRGAPAVQVPRLEGPATVDGQLDEAVWQQAARLTDFWQYEPVDGVPATEPTEVRVWYSPDAVWFGVVATDSRPDAIRATRADRDEIGGEDRVVLFLDTFDDRRRAFFFGVNPLGVQLDGVRAEGAASAGNPFGGTTDTNPDYVWESAATRTPTGWVAEIRIPFKSLSLPGAEPQRWGFQVLRYIQRTGYTYAWTDVRRASASFLLQAGTLEGFSGIERGVTLEAQPFVTASRDAARDPVTGAFSTGDVEPDAGINLHAGFGATALDATINPDFSQVEADAGQVTANQRFALFFPEKRPFFLDGIELFSTPNQLVYTRRIAQPIAGVKATGKLGGLGYAALSALDEGIGGAPDAMFTVARVRHDFATNSLLGAVVTDREATSGGGAFNRVGALDVRHVFAELYYVQGQLGAAWTGDDVDSRTGEIWEAEFDRTGYLWGFNYKVTGIAPDFDAQAGFVNRTGIVQAHAFNRFRLYGDAGDLMENFTIFVGPTRIWDYDTPFRDAVEGSESGDFGLLLRGGWNVGAHVERGFVHLDDAPYAGLEVLAPDSSTTPYSPLESVSGLSGRLSASTPVFQSFDAGVGVQYGDVAIFSEGSKGRETEVDAELGLRPTRWLRVAGSAVWQRIWRERDDSRFSQTVIPRLKAEVQPTRALFFRAIAEWRSERRAALVDARDGRPLVVAGQPVAGFDVDRLRLDLLASFEPTPGTVAFLGYGTTLAGERAFVYRPRALERADEGLFLKVAYRLRL